MNVQPLWNSTEQHNEGLQGGTRALRMERERPQGHHVCRHTAIMALHGLQGVLTASPPEEELAACGRAKIGHGAEAAGALRISMATQAAGP